jgi:UTP--glucose-1-phosphate uridylyltransferase
MGTEELKQFGRLLGQAREAAGLSRDALAQRVGLDTSYIYRIETGARRPSREATLTLAEALGVEGESLNKWLLAAGYAPMPLLTMVRGAVRTRGARRRAASESERTADWDSARWAEWLEAMGLQEAAIRRLLRAMETADAPGRQEAARTISAAISRAAEALEAPAHKAVIPAAGGHHQIIASHVMQRLLLRSIAEATESGITDIILVLAPGMTDSLYTPLKDALELAVAPSIKLQCVHQPSLDGLGDAILQTEELIGKEPFAVLLPDDVVRERIGRAAYPRELRRMMDTFSQQDCAHLVAVASVPKSKMPQCGVAKVAAKEIISNVFPVSQLVEKPDLSHPIFRSERIHGIVGRYLLSPDIFRTLRKLKEKKERPVQITTALEHLRQEGQSVCAFELKAARQDLGEVLEQASGLIGDSSE